MVFVEMFFKYNMEHILYTSVIFWW